MRLETENAIERKFEVFLRYKDKKTGETSSKRYMKIMGQYVEKPTKETSLAFLFGLFSAICYDVVAMLEARGVKLTEIERLWGKYHQKQEAKEWIDNAATSSSCVN